VQNLHYTYDPAGNITHIRDDAQQTIYFKNQRVEPSNDYTYDALYNRPVEGHCGLIAEGVAVAAGQEEMGARFLQLVGGGHIIWVKERPAGRNPPVVVGIGTGEAAVRFQRSALQVAAPVGSPRVYGVDRQDLRGIGQEGLAIAPKHLVQEPRG
jgi:hypothetical protein